MLCAEITAVYSDSHMKHTKRMCGQNAELLCFKGLSTTRESEICTSLHSAICKCVTVSHKNTKYLCTISRCIHRASWQLIKSFRKQHMHYILISKSVTPTYVSAFYKPSSGGVQVA
jgi:hypothetical protein